MKRIALIGSSGQLGSALIEAFSRRDQGFALIPLGHNEIEIGDHDRASKMLSELQPDVVINTAAYHRVDDCEKEFRKAFEINAFAARNLAVTCQQLGALIVHISTDYLFGGDSKRSVPYSEKDPPSPINVYGTSKLAGEQFIQAICARHIIVRTSGLFGPSPGDGDIRNFVDLMVHLSKQGKPIEVVTDQQMAPTYTLDLAEGIIDLLAHEQPGIYHLTNSGYCSWFEFAQYIFELTGDSPDLQPTSMRAFGAIASRPRYSVLDCSKSVTCGLLPMPRWQEGLEQYIAKYFGSLRSSVHPNPVMSASTV